jgi:hypothetical protein
MKRFLDRLEAISKILLIAGTLIGGIWAIREYFDKKHDSRVAETLGYVRRLSSDPLLAAQTRIGLAWYAVRDRVRILESTPVASAEEFANRKRQLVMMVVDKAVVPLSATMTQRGLVSDIDLVVAFFAELQVCADAGLCDRPTANSYFQPYAKRFYCVHEPFIEWKSASYSRGYGNELRTFAFSNGRNCLP